WKHRGALFRPKYGAAGFIGLPCIWLFQMALPLVAPVAEIALVSALAAGRWQIVVSYGGALFTLELAGGLLAYALEGERPDDLLLLPPQRVYYRPPLLDVPGPAPVAGVRGVWVEWVTIGRPTPSPHPLQSN